MVFYPRDELKYLYYIDLNNNYDSKKISFLQEMKKDLTNNNILIENKQFKEYFFLDILSYFARKNKK